MRETVTKAINLCIDAINNSGEGADKQVLETIKMIAERPYEGAGLGIGLEGFRGFRSSHEDLLERLVHRKTINGNLNWSTAFLFLCDAIHIDEQDILSFTVKLDDDIIFNHTLQHILSNLTAKNDLQNALKFIQYFRKTNIFEEEDNRDSGYLILLRYFASNGDATNFFKYFKLAEPRKNKSEIADLKAYLVQSFAAANGIQDSIALCKHKSLGAKYHINALQAFAMKGKYNEVKSLFEMFPELKQPENETEIEILSIAYCEAKKNKIEVADDFESLFERALQIDRKISSGAAKLQDSVLFNLGLAAYGNKERLLRCRKAIKNSSLKKELNA